MSRFVKGTFDHDGDGRPGGSKKAADSGKESIMATKKESAKKSDDKKETPAPGERGGKPDVAGSNDPASKSIARHPA